MFNLKVILKVTNSTGVITSGFIFLDELKFARVDRYIAVTIL